MRRIILTLFLVVASMGGRATAAEFVDYSTAHQMAVPFSDVSQNPLSLHICANYSFMIGVHVQANQFACEDVFTTEPPDSRESIRHGGPAQIKPNANPNALNMRYESYGMAACPPGTAMVGLHAAGNVLACAPVPQYYTLEFMVDPHTYRFLGTVNMHVCPKNWFMVGIHEGRDLLLCGRLKRK